MLYTGNMLSCVVLQRLAINLLGTVVGVRVMASYECEVVNSGQLHLFRYISTMWK